MECEVMYKSTDKWSDGNVGPCIISTYIVVRFTIIKNEVRS